MRFTQIQNGQTTKCSLKNLICVRDLISLKCFWALSYITWWSCQPHDFEVCFQFNHLFLQFYFSWLYWWSFSKSLCLPRFPFMKWSACLLLSFTGYFKVKSFLCTLLTCLLSKTIIHHWDTQPQKNPLYCSFCVLWPNKTRLESCEPRKELCKEKVSPSLFHCCSHWF